MKHRLFLLFLPLLAILFTACPSDPVDTTGSISGTVKDRFTNERIAGADVSLNPTNRSTTTDGNGNYQFLDVEQGQYTVTVKKSQYADVSTTLQVQVGQTTSHDFSLEPSSSALDVMPRTLDYGISQTQLGLDIINKGYGTLTWTITSDRTWLAVVGGQTGSVAPQRQTSVIIRVDRAGLPPGEQTANIVVTSTDGGHVDVPVHMTVVGPPQLTTTSYSSVTAHSVVVGARLTVVGDENGVTEYGHVYSDTNEAPSLENGDPHTSLHTDGGVLYQTGTFSSLLVGLRSATSYNVRAYARNRQGYNYGGTLVIRTEAASETGLDRNDFGGEEDWNRAGDQ